MIYRKPFAQLKTFLQVMNMIFLFIHGTMAYAQSSSPASDLILRQEPQNFKCPDYLGSRSLSELFESITGSSDCEIVTKIALGCKADPLSRALLARKALEQCVPPEIDLISSASDLYEQERGDCEKNFTTDTTADYVRRNQCLLLAARNARRMHNANLF